MPKDYHNDGLLYIAARTVIDCYLMTKQQLRVKCTKNKKTCGKPGCQYYWRDISCCVGELNEDKKVVVENKRCDDCIVSDMPWLNKYCWVMKRRLYSGKK